MDLTVSAGERVLAPVERFVGRRSLVGDTPFLATERFPWIAEIESHWREIRAEVERVLVDHDALPNFQDISRDQIEITDDDRWKTLFLYGYGFRADLVTELCPRTNELVRADPGDGHGDVLDPLAAQAHPRPPRPLQGRAALPPRPDRAAREGGLPDTRGRRDPPLGGGRRA